MRKVPEKEFFVDDNSIFVTHYEGQGRNYLVMIPPLFEELPRTRKLMVNAARFLSSEFGIHVVRFDYYGTGLSYGRFDEFSMTQARKDLAAVFDYIRQNDPASISLLGFRFGAYLAVELSRQSGIHQTVLWEPVLDLPAYLEEIFKSLIVDQVVTYGTVKFSQAELMEQLQRNGKILVNGYSVGLKAVDEFRHAKVLGLDDLRTTQVILWRRSTLNKYPFLSELNPVVCESVKTAWDHIKFMDYSSLELMDATSKLLVQQEAQ